MKSLLAIVVALLTTCSLYAEEPAIRLGDTMQTVMKVMGEPKGHVKAGNREYLSYHRGTIEMADGIVVAVKLISASEADQQKEEREKEWERRKRADEEAAARRHIESLRAVERALADPALLDMTPKEKVAYWEKLRAQHPNVELPPAYEEALAAVEKEQDHIRSEAAKMAVDRASRRRLSAPR